MQDTLSLLKYFQIKQYGKYKEEYNENSRQSHQLTFQGPALILTPIGGFACASGHGSKSYLLAFLHQNNHCNSDTINYK